MYCKECTWKMYDTDVTTDVNTPVSYPVVMESETDPSTESSFTKALASSPFSIPMPPKPGQPVSSISNFGNSDCGEPLVSHHLCLDFTPTEADDEAAQKKCCDFWEYIASRQDLQHLMVLPDIKISSQSNSGTDSVPITSAKTVEDPKTAISMLEMVEQKGLAERAFEIKLLHSGCTIKSQEYELGDKGNKDLCKCPSPCVICPHKVRSPVPPRALCKELHHWDKRHPKSMEPPGKSPSLGEIEIGKP